MKRYLQARAERDTARRERDNARAELATARLVIARQADDINQLTIRAMAAEQERDELNDQLALASTPAGIANTINAIASR